MNLHELEMCVLECHLKIVATKRKTTLYEIIGRAMGIFSAGTGAHLEELFKKNVENGEPLLGALVVKKSTEVPGDGFFSAAERHLGVHFADDASKLRFFEEQKERAFRAYAPESDVERELRLFADALTPQQLKMAQELIQERLSMNKEAL